MHRTRLLLAAGVLLLSVPQVFPDSPPVANAPGSLPDAPGLLNGMAVNLDTVLRLTYERNAEILAAHERVNESQIAFDAAMSSCMPEALRKDIFKKPVAEANLWRRRVELRKVENDNLHDAANTYIDWLTALRGEAVARDLMKYEDKLLERARRLAASQKVRQTQAVVETIETAVAGQQQYIAQTHQQSEAVAAKLAYLMGMNGGALTTIETLEPMNRVDTSVPVEVLVRQAQDNGPGVRELQGLIAAIQQGIDQARHAHKICARTGAALICGRLHMAESQRQQAQDSLVDLQLKLRAGVVEAFTAIVSGREQITLAAKMIERAADTYRTMDLLLTEEGLEANVRNKTYEGELNSIRQLSQAHGTYVTAVSNYNKAQVRLLLLLGTYTNNNCPQSKPS